MMGTIRLFEGRPAVPLKLLDESFSLNAETGKTPVSIAV